MTCKRLPICLVAFVTVSSTISGIEAQVSRPALERERTSRLFEFHSAFWLNLHHYLHALARQNSPRTARLPDAATAGERETWNSAVAHYRQHYATRRLVLDTDMVRLKGQLLAAKSDDSLPEVTDGELRRILESAARIYRRYWWPAHDARNRESIASIQPLLSRYGAPIARRLAASFDATWPTEPVRVDVVYDAGPPGDAYTTNDPTHVTIGAESLRDDLVSLELLFHEASHGWDAVFMNEIRDVAARLRLRVPAPLWHALLFHNAGAITADVLHADGVRDYVVYADRGGLFSEWRAPMPEPWQAYLAGNISRDEAIVRIVRDLVNRAKAQDTARKILARPMPGEEHLAARDDLAKRQAAAAIWLLRVGQADVVWPLLRHSSDPSRRSYLIRDMGQSGVDAAVVARRLQTETDASARRALILALGGFDASEVADSLRTALVAQLLSHYQNDPDPGVHSAIDWLLRHGKQGLADRRLNWKQAHALRRIDEQLPSQLSGDRRWFVTKEGHTMAIVDGPVQFTMGSPPFETYRPKGPAEAQHGVRIPRSFAIATKEVTVAQFQRFLDAHPEIRRAAQRDASRDPSRGSPTMRSASPDDESPQVSITWFEAAQYCNWLSQQEGIPEDQWAYPKIDQIKEGVELPQGHLDRTGYRLPTDAEWEFAARAGATTAWFYGSSEELLREYAWYAGTTFAERSWPVGQLKPNDLGLFDVHGNVWEWIHDQWKPHPSDARSEGRVDVEGTVRIVSAQYKRPRRGGSYSYDASYLRSAHRGSYIPDERRDNVGFRVARTIR